MEVLETDGTTTGAEDLKWRKQHNAINPYAKQKNSAQESGEPAQYARALSASGLSGERELELKRK